MSGDSFFPLGAKPPTCPKCNVTFMVGDTVENVGETEQRQHVDCDNPQGVIDSRADRIKKKLRGEQV